MGSAMHTNTTHRRFTIILGLSIASSIIFGTAHGIAGDFGRRYGASSRLLQRPFYFQNRRANNAQLQHCIKTQCSQPCQHKKACRCLCC